MRYVDRSRSPIPEILTSERAKVALDQVHQFLKLTDVERAQRRAPYDERIIFRTDVRPRLEVLFSHKCAYCESRAPSTIDHLRPKSLYPWLAYDWDNIYPACADCNNRKGGHFPTAGLRSFPYSTVQEARSTEQALLVDPCYDDPSAHIHIQRDGSYRALSEKGLCTIKVFGLNRSHLCIDRQEIIQQIETELQRQPVARYIETFIDPNARFAGAAAQFLGSVLKAATGMRPRGNIVGPSMKVIESILRLSPAVIYDALNKLTADQVDEARVPERQSGGSKQTYIPSTPSPAAVSQIEISNFKGINRLKLKIPSHRHESGSAGALMLLGENAAGKSSVLEAIALAILGARDGSNLVLAEDLLRRKGRQRLELVDTEAATVKITFHDRTEPATLHIDPLVRRLISTPQPRSVIIGYGPRRYSKDGARWSKVKSARVRSLFRPAVALPDPTVWLRDIAMNDLARFNAVARGLREILALRMSDDLVLDDEIGVCVRVQGRLEPVSRLSEGYRSLFAMAVDIMRELLRDQPELESACGVVLIDEVETHLHPRWKMRVMSALRRAMPNVTFIATTHDPLCLRGMVNGEVAVLVKDEMHHVSVLDDLPDITGMRAEQLLTSDYFGLNSTAAPEVEADLADYVAALIQAKAGDPTAATEAKRLGDGLLGTLVLGNSAADQVAQQALGRYLADREELPSIERSTSRKEVIERMLDALRRPLED
ncbi:MULTISPECIES: AAA family ATPase [unclassified Rhizobium]|uniref:AAA family ATPase n=1 Tax=unclassified Rhizobium TaxID=2613769 RepID=UPI001783CB19|nr:MULTISPECIES: AAA family ATPase [unclassified Rhizobium]MBD8689601.1 AAA family ATPase [Rhizobium sp. CFBP 13644]MBD8694208.1 AAA family ATPase [Rhizobium sp. CFBP 13717]